MDQTAKANPEGNIECSISTEGDMETTTSPEENIRHSSFPWDVQPYFYYFYQDKTQTFTLYSQSNQSFPTS